MKKLMVVLVALMSFGTANAANPIVIKGVEYAPTTAGAAAIMGGVAVGGIALAMTHEPCANSNAPVKYIKQDGANYLTSVAGCEVKYPK